jgi:electron transfer flavoprotein alpha subunit
MAGRVLIIGEHWKGKPEGINFQMLTKGREIADAKGASLGILLLGQGLDPVVTALKDRGADEIFTIDDATLAQGGGDVHAHAYAEAIGVLKPEIVLIGYTLVGMELTPAIAAKLGVPALTNCVNVEAKDGKVIATRPYFESSVQARVVLEGTPLVVAIQKGATPTLALPAKDAKVEAVAIDKSKIQVRTQVIEWVEEPAGEIDLTKADIIVSVGRGIGDKEKIGVVDDLAQALGGMMGCSRPLVDQGWLPRARQVGASGNTVTPKVYVACGISGASQHLAGMSESKMIIAINKDANAPIFQVAHVGIIGDLFEIVPAIAAEARKRNS